MKNKRKEIQPEDIWNDEKLDMVKEHILNRIKNKFPEDIVETELMAKKYSEEDMRQAMITVIVSNTIKGSKDIDDYINSLNKK